MKMSISLRQPIDNRIYLAGEFCYGEFIGTAHGAYQTGIEAARKIMKKYK